jgi:hypothetical protein
MYGWTNEGLNRPSPNPGLAALLGLIPGVGAMYNEQYAKGGVHLVVFAVLCSLADHVNGIFTLFVFGWIAYMAIEAHHTARARRDGTPLPNPFGLNDIGERMGFGKAWPAGPTVAEVASDAASVAAQAVGPRPAPAQPYIPPQAQRWGSPVETGNAPAPGSAAYAQAYRDMGYDGQYPGPATPYTPPSSTPYTPVSPIEPVPYPPIPARFPAGAVVLIGLGTIFLLANTGIFSGFSAEGILGTVLLGFSVWCFLQRMTDSGLTLANDHTPTYPLRLLQAIRASVWTGLIGLLLLLDGFNILHWRHSWPFFIIVPGVLALLDRAAYQSAATAYMPPITAPSPGEPSETDTTTKGAL